MAISEMLSKMDNMDVEIGRMHRFLIRRIEPILVGTIILVIVLVNLFVVNKPAVIALYFLPVLVAGYLRGTRFAVLTAVFSICVVIFSALIDPSDYYIPPTKVHVFLFLGAWGGFMVLAAAVVGRLYGEKEKRLRNLRDAYIGMFEMVINFVESPHRDLRAHLLRCANMAKHLAKACGLSDTTSTFTYFAAILHDSVKLDVSLDVLESMAAGIQKEQFTMQVYGERNGEQFLDKLVTVARGTLAIVRQRDAQGPVPIEVKIIRVADLYDTMTEAQNMTPRWALAEIEQIAASWIEPTLLAGLEQIARIHDRRQPPKTAVLQPS